MIIVTLEVYITPTRSILPLVVLLIIRYCFELRRRFAVSFRHSFENFDFTSKLEGGSPSHFDTVSNLKNIRYCFEIRLRFDVAIRTDNEIYKYEVPTRWRRIKLIINPTNHTYTHTYEIGFCDRWAFNQI